MKNFNDNAERLNTRQDTQGEYTASLWSYA